MTGGTAGDISFSRGENPLRADKLNSAFVERVLRAGDSMTGPFILVRDPVVPFEAATKQYVDGRFSTAVMSTIPPAPSPGRLWFDANTGQLFVWYDDGTSAQWVIANNLGTAGSGGGGFLPLTGGTIGTPGWLEALIPATETNSDFVSLANRGGSAGVFGTKTSNAPGTSTGAQGAWSIGGFAINDSSAHVQTAYAGYFEARRNVGTGVTQGIEIAVVNRGNVFQSSPYNWSEIGMTIGLLLGAGRGDVTPNNNPTTALLITGGNAKWQSGIVIAENSLAPNGAYPPAPVVLDMPKGYTLLWRDSTDRPAAYIRSDVTTSPDYHGMGGIIFTNTGLQLNSADGQAAVALNNSGLFVYGSLTAAGNTSVGGTFGVNQGAVFGNALLVLGPVTAKDKITIQNSGGGNTVILDTAGNVSAAGTAAFALDLTVGRNASITGTMLVHAAVNFDSTLVVGGDAAFAKGLVAVGAFWSQGSTRLSGVWSYVNNAAAIAAGRVSGDVYRNSTVGALDVVV